MVKFAFFLGFSDTQILVLERYKLYLSTPKISGQNMKIEYDYVPWIDGRWDIRNNNSCIYVKIVRCKIAITIS